MPSSHDDALPTSDYYFRRELTAAELLAPVALGAAVGLTVFYLARLLAQRTPLTEGEGRTASRLSRGNRPITPRHA